MADIELIIKIPEESYKFAKECKLKDSSKYDWNLSHDDIVLRVANGIPFPFMNKPCISSEVCKYDKNKALDRIRAKITELDNKVCQQFLIEDADKDVHHAYQDCLKIIDECKAEIEAQREL